MATAQRNFNLISSGKVEGVAVYNRSGESLGSIDHLMIDRVTGVVRYVVTSFGGFLGVGHNHYPLPWSAIRFDPELDGFVTDITQTQLKDAPEFSDDSWTDPAWEARLNAYFGTPIEPPTMTRPRE